MSNFSEIIFKDNGNLKNQLNFNFFTNNVKGLQSNKKRLKLFNLLNNKKIKSIPIQTQVNMSQHESTRVRHKSTRINTSQKVS